MKLLLLLCVYSIECPLHARACPCFCLASVVSMGTLVLSERKKDTQPNRLPELRAGESQPSHPPSALLTEKKRYFRPLLINPCNGRNSLERLCSAFHFQEIRKRVKAKDIFLFPVFSDRWLFFGFWKWDSLCVRYDYKFNHLVIVTHFTGSCTSLAGASNPIL